MNSEGKKCRHCSVVFYQNQLSKHDFEKKFCCSRACGQKSRARSTDKERLMNLVKIDANGCWIFQGFINGFGYGMFGLRGMPTTAAHRAAYRVFKGPIRKDMKICHTCDVRACVNPEHLWEGTSSENNQDCWDKKRRKRLLPKKAKLTPEQAREIIELRKNKVPFKNIAEQYSVSLRVIEGIIYFGNYSGF